MNKDDKLACFVFCLLLDRPKNAKHLCAVGKELFFSAGREKGDYECLRFLSGNNPEQAEWQAFSPVVGIRTPPPPLPLASVLLLEHKGGWGVPIPTTEKA